MHVSAHSSTETVGVPEEFQQDKDWVDASHDQGRSSPMIEGQGITLSHLPDNSGCNGFFAYSQVHFTGDFPVIPELNDGLFEQAAPEHRSVELKKIRPQIFLLFFQVSIFPPMDISE
jgi:hypothetical protein